MVAVAVKVSEKPRSTPLERINAGRIDTPPKFVDRQPVVFRKESYRVQLRRNARVNWASELCMNDHQPLEEYGPPFIRCEYGYYMLRDAHGNVKFCHETEISQ